MEPRIVCAANLCEDTGIVILGVRHWDTFMRENKNDINVFWDSAFSTNVEQGFVDQFGKFYTRTEAWKIAEKNNQIIRRVGGDTANGGTLYSENLY